MNKLLVFAVLLAGAVEVGSAASRVVSVSLDGMIHPVTVEIIGHAVEQASREHADALLIRLNTPGGLLEATRQINEKIIASPVPVITYVAPGGGRAASAGFFILQAGDIAAMAPGTNTGAASPILLGQQMDPVLRQKVENDAAASLRTLTGKRGRNTELAEKAVLQAKSFTEKEALDSKLIDVIANDSKQLFQILDGREIERFNGGKQRLRLAEVTVVEYQLGIRERLISAIADPNLAFILLALGGLGIYVEFSAPGLFIPGVAGGILVLMGLSALAVLPINLVGVGLLILAVAFFVLEAKFASHGILGAGGTIAMMLGALLLVEGPPEMRIRLATAIAVTLPFSAITIFLVTLVMRSRASKVITGESGMVGQLGVAQTNLDPKGMVQVRGEYWSATASSAVGAGAPVRVTAIDGLSLLVEPVPN